jgi:hypothetical protein
MCFDQIYLPCCTALNPSLLLPFQIVFSGFHYAIFICIFNVLQSHHPTAVPLLAPTGPSYNSPLLYSYPIIIIIISSSSSSSNILGQDSAYE